MDFIQENAGCLSVLILLIAAAISYPSLFGSFFLRERKKPRVKKSRAQHEAELEEMWREEVNPAPPTKAEKARWARENNETYIRNTAAWADHQVTYNEFGYVDGWKETVIDNFGNEVVVHNSDGTGYLDR